MLMIFEIFTTQKLCSLVLACILSMNFDAWSFTKICEHSATSFWRGWWGWMELAQDKDRWQAAEYGKEPSGSIKMRGIS
jgi:hypothetical protein